jgi:chromosome segregation ATPase
MTNDERQELVTAVREALGSFKEELKAEMQGELLQPMEARLRGEMGEMETRLQGEMGEMETRLQGGIGEMETRLQGGMGEMETRLQGQITGLGERMDRLEAELRSLTNDVVVPFVEAVGKQHQALVERLDRLERQVERNRTSINQLHIKVDQQERRLFAIADDVAIIRERLSNLEQQLGGEAAYDVAQAKLMVAEERGVYEMIRELEDRIARLEAEMRGEGK